MHQKCGLTPKCATNKYFRYVLILLNQLLQLSTMAETSDQNNRQLHLTKLTNSGSLTTITATWITKSEFECIFKCLRVSDCLTLAIKQIGPHHFSCAASAPLTG